MNSGASEANRLFRVGHKHGNPLKWSHRGLLGLTKWLQNGVTALNLKYSRKQGINDLQVPGFQICIALGQSQTFPNSQQTNSFNNN